MLWFKKNSAALHDVNGDRVAPVPLQVELDKNICAHKLNQLIEAAEERGGLEQYIEALNTKHHLFQDALSASELPELDAEGFAILLDAVFPARRKLPTGTDAVSHEALLKQMSILMHGRENVSERMGSFADLFATDNRKIKRAAWDFAAEALHFFAPGKYPLMTRWVWDSGSVSGALREFIRSNDGMSDVPISNEPGQFEAARVWLAEQIAEQGYYRDVPFMVDLLLAQAYADYFIAMSSGVGMMAGEFGGRIEPIDFICKLLGIEAGKRSGRLRVKQNVIH
ncbi:MAG: hypothetical protein OEZ43_08760 [Gammaproteobacteria bacterium]|nr:hypothetical protein [Gammaproteobacteria bacterium]